MNSEQKSILLVELDETIRKILEIMLHYEGYTVVSVTSGEEALEIFQNDPHKFTLVLTDFMMPHMNGAELVQKIRGTSDVPIILTTTNTTISQDKVEEWQIQSLIYKPYQYDRLLNEIEALAQ